MESIKVPLANPYEVDPGYPSGNNYYVINSYMGLNFFRCWPAGQMLPTGWIREDRPTTWYKNPITKKLEITRQEVVQGYTVEVKYETPYVVAPSMKDPISTTDSKGRRYYFQITTDLQVNFIDEYPVGSKIQEAGSMWSVLPYTMEKLDGGKVTFTLTTDDGETIVFETQGKAHNGEVATATRGSITYYFNYTASDLMTMSGAGATWRRESSGAIIARKNGIDFIIKSQPSGVGGTSGGSRIAYELEGDGYYTIDSEKGLNFLDYYPPNSTMNGRDGSVWQKFANYTVITVTDSSGAKKVYSISSTDPKAALYAYSDDEDALAYPLNTQRAINFVYNAPTGASITGGDLVTAWFKENDGMVYITNTKTHRIYKIPGGLGSDAWQDIWPNDIDPESGLTYEQVHGTVNGSGYGEWTGDPKKKPANWDRRNRNLLTDEYELTDERIFWGNSEDQVFDFDADKVLNKYADKHPHGISNMDLVSSCCYFNVSKLPDYNNMPMPYIGHIIFTRPSLNINVTPFVNGTLNSAYGTGGSYYPSEEPDPIKNMATLLSEAKTAGFVQDPMAVECLKMLSDTTAGRGYHFYMPLFTNRAMSYTTADVSLKSIDKSQTFYGHVIKYGHYSEDHKFGGTITLDFRNDRYWSVLKTCYLWMSYIHLVSKSDKIKPTWVHQMNGVLDYCGSIYYLVTLMDGRTLVYWEKLTGVYPKSVPFSSFGFEDTIKIEEKVSIDFDFGIKSEPKDPEVLYDLNCLSALELGSGLGNWVDTSSGGGAGYANMLWTQGPALMGGGVEDWSNPDFLRRYKQVAVMPHDFRGGQYKVGDVYAGYPCVQYVKQQGGGAKFLLHWLKAIPTRAVTLNR